MYIDGNGMQIPCAAVHRAGGWTFAGEGVEDVNGAFVLRADDGTLLREFNTSDWLRVVRGTGSLMLTDAPEPVAPPEPAEPEPGELEILQAENKTLKAQVQALSEQQGFYEDCIAEMASVVYA